MGWDTTTFGGGISYQTEAYSLSVESFVPQGREEKKPAATFIS